MDKPLVLTGVGGKGIINSVINNLPFELHIPGYRFCGPGTKLQHRIHQTGINPLDDACKAHDIAYSQSKSLESRHKADQLLEQEAWKRLTDKNSSLLEKTSALMVGNMMKAKVKLGAGNKNRPTFNQLVKAVGVTETTRGSDLVKSSQLALKKAKKYLKKHNNNIKPPPRVIPLRRKRWVGGVLPIIPILAGLSALGSLAGGAATIARTVKDVDQAKKALQEQKRHNMVMEAQKVGQGLYLKPYGKGLGLYRKKTNH